MKKLNTIKLVEELTQEQLNILKNLVCWGNTKMADYGNITEQEKQEIDRAILDDEISNKTIYKLFRDIYFTDKAILKLKEQMI